MMDEKEKLPQKKDIQPNNIMNTIDAFFSSSPIKGMLKQMDDFFGHTFSEASLPVETQETDRDFLVVCKLPGIAKEQINIETFDRYLTISVKNEQQVKTIDETVSYVSNSYTSNISKRTIPLPEYVKIQALQANYRDGLLKIRILKS